MGCRSSIVMDSIESALFETCQRHLAQSLGQVNFLALLGEFLVDVAGDFQRVKIGQAILQDQQRIDGSLT